MQARCVLRGIFIERYRRRTFRLYSGVSNEPIIKGRNPALDLILQSEFLFFRVYFFWYARTIYQYSGSPGNNSASKIKTGPISPTDPAVLYFKT